MDREELRKTLERDRQILNMHFESHRQLSTLSAAIPVLIVALYGGFDLDANTARVFLVACAGALYASLVGMLVAVYWSSSDIPFPWWLWTWLYSLLVLGVIALGTGVISLLVFLLGGCEKVSPAPFRYHRTPGGARRGASVVA